MKNSGNSNVFLIAILTILGLFAILLWKASAVLQLDFAVASKVILSSAGALLVYISLVYWTAKDDFPMPFRVYFWPALPVFLSIIWVFWFPAMDDWAQKKVWESALGTGSQINWTSEPIVNFIWYDKWCFRLLGWLAPYALYLLVPFRRWSS
jgi:hypothetical protein